MDDRRDGGDSDQAVADGADGADGAGSEPPFGDVPVPAREHVPADDGVPAGAPAWTSDPPQQPADYWVRPAGGPPEPLAPPRGTLRVLSVVTRSIDLFLRRPVPFLKIGLPTALFSASTSLLYLIGGGPQLYTPGVVPQPPSAAVALGIVIALIALVVGISLSLAMTLAADDVRAGRSVDLRERFGRGFGRTGIAILSWIAEYLVLFGVLIGGAIVVGILALTRSIPLVVIGSLVLMVGLLWMILRWAFSTTAIALEPIGPLQALGRSRAVTRGNVWRIVAVYLVLGVIALPLSAGIGLLSLSVSDIPIVVLLLTTFASFVTYPLLGIVSAMIFGDLTGRPEAPRSAADGQTRLLFIVAIIAVGVISLAIAIPRLPAAFERLAVQGVPAQNRGVIVAGPFRSPFDPCQPVPGGNTLSHSQPIYLGGYFTRPIPRGEAGRVEMYLDERLVKSETLTDPLRSISCWSEPEPLVSPSAAHWRIEVHYLDETIAEGIFDVR